MGRLFGTDGVRGVANAELDCDLAFRLGQAAATVLTETTRHKPKILIGKDTRISSDMLEAALTAGVCSVGGDAVSLGVIPTPAVAYLVKEYAADAGFVVSASHNPFEHNGIKIFNVLSTTIRTDSISIPIAAPPIRRSSAAMSRRTTVRRDLPLMGTPTGCLPWMRTGV